MADSHRIGHGGMTDMDGLNEGDLRFLEEIADHAGDRDADDGETAPPRFPAITVTVITVIFLLVLVAMSYAFMTAAQYVPVMQVGGMEELARTDDAAKAMKTMADAYGMRYAAYGIVAAIYVIALAAVAIIHRIHVRRWEDSADDDSEDDR